MALSIKITSFSLQEMSNESVEQYSTMAEIRILIQCICCLGQGPFIFGMNILRLSVQEKLQRWKIHRLRIIFPPFEMLSCTLTDFNSEKITSKGMDVEILVKVTERGF